MNNTQTQMTTAFQTNLTDTRYNGWTNYETWNVSLWIQNDEGLYDIARLCETYQDFVDALGGCSFNELKTDDGVSYTDAQLNTVELDEMITEL